MFTDSIYENLDEISQLVEPFQCAINDAMAKFPSEMIFNFNAIYNFAKRNSNYYSFSSLSLRSIIRQQCAKYDVSYDSIKEEPLEHWFKFQVDKDTVFDLENKTLSHDIKIIKQKEFYTDDECRNLITRNLINTLHACTSKASRVSKANINEIADIFDILDIRKEQALQPKKNRLIKGLVAQFEDHTINIRNLELGYRFADWIAAYAKYGHLGAIKNLTLFKVMMLKGLPIYNLDNEEIL